MGGLSWAEWAGVTAVGLGLSYAASKLVDAQDTPDAHRWAMLLTGAGLYVVGVGIGASRPEEGWIGGGTYIPSQIEEQ